MASTSNASTTNWISCIILLQSESAMHHPPVLIQFINISIMSRKVHLPKVSKVATLKLWTVYNLCMIVHYLQCSTELTLRACLLNRQRQTEGRRGENDTEKKAHKQKKKDNFLADKWTVYRDRHINTQTDTERQWKWREKGAEWGGVGAERESERQKERQAGMQAKQGRETDKTEIEPERKGWCWWREVITEPGCLIV